MDSKILMIVEEQGYCFSGVFDHFPKIITFKSPTKGKGTVLEFSRFCMTYLLTFCVSLILLPLIVELGGIDPKMAGALVILLCTGISYLGHSRFSFKREPAC